MYCRSENAVVQILYSFPRFSVASRCKFVLKFEFCECHNCHLICDIQIVFLHEILTLFNIHSTLFDVNSYANGAL